MVHGSHRARSLCGGNPGGDQADHAGQDRSEEVSSFAEVRPSNMEQMKAYQLQGLCEKWGIQTGGAKKDLLMRLEDLFAGREVPKKKCTVQFVKLVEEEPSTYGSMAGSAPATPLRPEPGGQRPCPQRGHHGVAE